MKQLVADYTFNAATKKVTFSKFASIELERILLITNVTDGIIIYNFANSSLGGTVSGNVLTLTYNTVSMSNTDELQIFYDYPDAGLSDILHVLQSISAKLPMADTQLRMRTITEMASGQAIGNTPSTTSSGGYNLYYQPFADHNAAWGVLRSKIHVG